MPLLKKKAFEKASPEEFLKDDEEVFYCELTNEIFRNYEEYAERMLLCTSMVWTCAMTGKSNLTYEEALESEENARKTISEFPVELKIPVLYVATKTKRTGFGDMAEDVFLYCKDRYFIGEKLESCFSGNKWVESHVLQVIAPTEAEIEKDRSQNGTSEKNMVPPPSLYKYEIEHLDADDNDISEIMIVDHNQLKRKKAIFSREKCKLFIKQHVQQDSNLQWIIKPTAIKAFGIDKMKFERIFSGPEPSFDSSKRSDKKTNSAAPVNGKKARQETLAKYLTKLNQPAKMNGTSTTLKKSKESEEKSAQLLEEMERRKEEYNKMKEEKEKEQKWVSAQLRCWYRTREDLGLIDQQPLPEIPQLKSEIPEELIGDVIMLMEFIKKFSSVLTPRKFIQGNVTLKLMYRALLEAEVAGPLVDLIQMFLVAIFREQGEEYPCQATFLKNIDVSNMSIEDYIKFATLAAHWPKQCQGLYLRELPLYSLTVSEVLRLHLLSSGSKLAETGEKKRLYLRGAYTSSDDPGFMLRVNKPHIIKALAFKNVTQLDLEDKIEILSCLMYQLLSCPKLRDSVEEGREKSLQAKFKVKTLQRELKKRDAEFSSSMWHIKRRLKKEPEAAKEVEHLKSEDAKQKLKITEELEDACKDAYEEDIFLGMDRAYRKYHKLNSIPAVLVDSSEDNPGICLKEKTEQYPELVKANRSVISKYLEKNINSLKNKELDDEELITNGNEVTPETNGIEPAENGHGEDVSDLEDDKRMMCSADRHTCRVHSRRRKKGKWMVFNQPELLDEVISALNTRGIREGELCEALKADKERLEKNILETPCQLLGEEEEVDGQNATRSAKKTYIEANFGFPAGTPIDEILQNTLTDEILELEEKIFTGSLGQLRVKNREEWRNALSNKDYKNFDREIARRVFQLEDGVDQKEEDVEDEGLEDKRGFRDKDPGDFLVLNNDIKIEQPSNMKEAVECIAIALAQVAHSIEPKFLEKPLGYSDNKKVVNYSVSKNPLQKWEKSLLLSTSFSQIFLHFGTLDSSVMWRRSTHHAKCSRCSRRGDSENMLLCDNCNRGFHMYCLKPKLKKIPNGEWFCTQCEASKEKEERNVGSEVLPKKKQRIFKEEDEDNHLNGEIENGDSTNSESEGSIEVDLCASCNSGGVLINCEQCETLYHKECTVPPIARSKHWVCKKCKDDSDESSDEPKVQNNNERRRSRRSERDSKKNEESEDSSDSDNYPLVRCHRAVGIINNERRSAAKARNTISNFVKSLRRLSPSHDDSDSGDSSKTSSKRKRSFRRECGRDDLPLHNAALQDLLQELMKHPDAWPFLRPVKSFEVPDYHDVISNPMDFGTIKYKLNMGEYQTDSQVMNDAALVFQNCNLYNEEGSEIHKCGQTVLKTFRNKCEELGFDFPSKLADEEVPDRKRRRKLY